MSTCHHQGHEGEQDIVPSLREFTIYFEPAIVLVALYLLQHI